MIKMISSFFKSVFGSLTWQPPDWISLTAEKLFGTILLILISYLRLLDEKPRKFIILNLSLIALVLSSICGYQWYKNLPQPEILSFSFTELAAKPVDQPDIKPQPLTLAFSRPAAAINLIGKNVSSAIKIAPLIPGEWKWSTDQLLEFQPKSDWPVGQKYSVSLAKNLFTKNIRLEKYSFSFDSPAFRVLSQHPEFYQDPVDPRIKQAVLKLKFSYLADKSDLERKISVRMRSEPNKDFNSSESKSLGFRLSFDDQHAEAFIRSDIIDIPEKDSEIQFKIEAGLKPAAGGSGIKEGLLANVAVLGIDNFFKISDVSESIVTNRETYQAERIFSVISTAPVSQKELARNTEAYLIPDDPELYKMITEDSVGARDSASTEEQNESEDSEYQPDADTCPWNSAAEIPQIALRRAEKLPISWIESEKVSASENSFRIASEAGRCVLIKIKQGTQSFAQIPLTTNKAFLVKTAEYPQDIVFTEKGAVLSLAGDRKINVLSRGVEHIKFELYRILPNSLQHLGQMGFRYASSYSNPSFDYGFGPENISEVYESVVENPALEPSAPQYNTFDFGRYLDSYPQNERGLFILKASAFDPATNSSFEPQTEKMILVSNLGFLVKKNQDNSRHVFVMSTSEKAAVVGANVEVLGKNGQAIISATTDSQGRVDIPDLKDFQYEKEPTVFVVRDGSDLSFMPYSLSDRSLNFSRFDSAGLYTVNDSQSLQAYIFSDRGIYRPGETANLALIVKTLNWQTLPANIPYEISVRDPREVEILRQRIKFPANGLSEFKLPVSGDALTGTYNISLSLIGQGEQRITLGQSSLRVEEFLPDRLRINAKWSSPANKGWLNPQGLKATLSLNNLYGTPSEGHKLKAEIKLRPYAFFFKEFADYSFFDPYQKKNSFDDNLGEILTDKNGEGSFELGLERFEGANYALNAVFQGFEKDGGRSVLTSLNSLVSPLDYLLGWKADGDINFIKKDFKQSVELIAVNPDLQKIAAEDLVLERFEERYVSVLTRQSSGNLEYQSVLKTIPLAAVKLSIPQQGFLLVPDSTTPGNFYYQIKNSAGLILNKINYKVVGQADLSRNMEKNAELQLKLNKSDYNPGETIEIAIQAPYHGSGLISIERDKVYASKWFSADTTSSIQTIDIPAGLEGNAYVNIAFVRSLDSKEIYTSPLSYALAPFSISKDARNEKLLIDVPDKIQPGETLSVSASSTEKTRAVIYAVDEGILQVARYKKPDPLAHFFRKRALEVGTMQILDMLLPEYNLLRDSYAAGGDDDALLGKHRNPFKRKGQKPVVFWSGIVELSNAPKSFSFDIPDYFNGSIKVFAVSVSENKIGAVEKQVTVQAPLVLLPNAPLFASPGDEFSVSVAVANTALVDNKIEVSLSSDDALQVLSEPKSLLTIDQGQEKLLEFKVKALNKSGNANLEFFASNSVAKSRYSIDLSIRPASPRLNTSQFGYIKASSFSSGSEVLRLQRQLNPELSERKLSFSALPLSLSYALTKYLDYFPHGCSEQITSQAFPLLLLSDFNFPGIKTDQREKAIAKTLQTLGARQQENGSIVFWPGYERTDRWLNLHIARFVLEAQQRNIPVSQYLTSGLESYLREIASASLPLRTLSDAREKAYAIYILTRMGKVTTNYLQTLKEEIAEIKGWEQDITALLMASGYIQLELDQETARMLKSFNLTVFADSALKQNCPLFRQQSAIGLALDLLSRHFPEKLKNIEGSFFEKISNSLNSEQFSTIEAANLILGLSSYSKAVNQTSSQDVSAEGSEDGQLFTPLNIIKSTVSAIDLKAEIKAVKLLPKSDATVFYQLFESGFDKPESQVPPNNGLEVFREYLDTSGKVSEQFRLGDDITVSILLRNTDGRSYFENIAVIDMLPSGLEINSGSAGLKNQQSGSSWNQKFSDATEDRALFYGDLGDGAARISYKAKAIAKGSFVIPPLQAEAMYDPAKFARSPAGRLTIN